MVGRQKAGPDGRVPAAPGEVNTEHFLGSVCAPTHSEPPTPLSRGQSLQGVIICLTQGPGSLSLWHGLYEKKETKMQTPSGLLTLKIIYM